MTEVRPRPSGALAPGAASTTRPSRRLARRVNWRVAAVRIPANGLALALTAFLLPGIHITTSRPVLGLLLLGAVFGLLNAFVKPALQYLTLPLLLESLGLVVILVDLVVFWLFDLLFPHVVATDGFLWLLAGAVVLGVLSFLIDNVLGLTPPIVDDRAERA